MCVNVWAGVCLLQRDVLGAFEVQGGPLRGLFERAATATTEPVELHAFLSTIALY